MTNEPEPGPDRRLAAGHADAAGGARVLLIKSMPLERDSRSQKMVAEYRRRGSRVINLLWTRGDPVAEEEDLVAFRRAGRYGAKLGSLFNYMLWLGFIARTIVRLRKSIEIIHLVDFNTALVGVPLGRLFGKLVVYDAGDHFAQVFPQGSWRWRLSARWERRLVERSDLAIFPDPIRLTQYGVEHIRHACIVGNIPEEDTAVLPDPAASRPCSGPFTMVYIGTLEAEHRGLEYVPRLCADHPGRIAFIVGGLGQLTDYFREQAEGLDNLAYVGPQPYAEALRLMAGADALYGPYLLSTPAHLYAAPNKMYEHLLLGRPLITNSGTPPAALVEAHGTGFLFDGSYEALDRLVASLDRDACAKAGARARRLWEVEYRDLRQRQVEEYFVALNAKLAPGRLRAEAGR
ncbi:MAG TPA: hypothetical protein VEC11_06430 [Allosphingosinicella sp.]|nr:hypothetical protein [Allosphingosinicella sp.]